MQASCGNTGGGQHVHEAFGPGALPNGRATRDARITCATASIAACWGVSVVWLGAIPIVTAPDVTNFTSPQQVAGARRAYGDRSATCFAGARPCAWRRGACDTAT